MQTSKSNLLLTGETEATTRVRNRHTNSRVIIEIVCSTLEDKAKAKECINYHLETLQPQFKVCKNKLTVPFCRLIPTCSRYKKDWKLLSRH